MAKLNWAPFFRGEGIRTYLCVKRVPVLDDCHLRGSSIYGLVSQNSIFTGRGRITRWALLLDLTWNIFGRSIIPFQYYYPTCSPRKKKIGHHQDCYYSETDCSSEISSILTRHLTFFRGRGLDQQHLEVPSAWPDRYCTISPGKAQKTFPNLHINSATEMIIFVASGSVVSPVLRNIAIVLGFFFSPFGRIQVGWGQAGQAA